MYEMFSLTITEFTLTRTKQLTIKELMMNFLKNIIVTIHHANLLRVRSRAALLVMGAAAVILTCGPAHAYLGGFEDPDGYKPFLNDVVTYNAGAYGANAGGGAYTLITPNTGLWTKLQGPLYPATGTAGGIAYGTGHQNFDRTNPSTSDQALVITTNVDGWGAGPQEYSYSLDSFDLGGVNPLSTGGQIVNLSFWSCAQIFGIGEGGGLLADTIGDTISFYDSSGTLGFEVGYRQPGTTTDFAATNVNGTWVQSTVSVNPSTYHRWDITLDLGLQTVSIDIFEGATLTNLVTGSSLINNMANFTELRFESTAGINNAKIWSLDDFTVQVVPEPTSLALLGLGGLALLRRQRTMARN
jgi:hypothetical protein